MNAAATATLASKFQPGQYIEVAPRFDDLGAEIDDFGYRCGWVVAVSGYDVEVDVIGKGETFVVASRLRSVRA